MMELDIQMIEHSVDVISVQFEDFDSAQFFTHFLNTWPLLNSWRLSAWLPNQGVLSPNPNEDFDFELQVF